MKIVHAADLHLDSPLTGLARYPSLPTDEIRGATRQAMVNLLNLCREEKASLLLIAGDLFDGDWKDHHTGLFFHRIMVELREAGVKVCMVRGNHDATSKLTRALHLPDNVVELAADRACTQVYEELGVAVHGQSYRSGKEDRNLAVGLPAPVAGAINLGLLHTSLDGREPHAPYAPCSPADLVNRGYDYWALGHVHAREVVAERPWIVFPGNLQGRHAKETGAKGATLIEIEDGAITSVEHRACDVLRWHHLHLDTTELDHRDALAELTKTATEAACADAAERPLVVRVKLEGTTALSGELRRDPAGLRAEVQSAVVEGGGGRAWLEKLVIETELPKRHGADNETLGELFGVLEELAPTLFAHGEPPAGLADLQKKLPSLYRRLEHAINPTSADELATRVRAAAERLRAELLGKGGRS